MSLYLSLTYVTPVEHAAHAKVKIHCLHKAGGYIVFVVTAWWNNSTSSTEQKMQQDATCFLFNSSIYGGQWHDNRPCRPGNAGGPRGSGALELYAMHKHTRWLGCILSLLFVLFMFLAPATTCQ